MIPQNTPSQSAGAKIFNYKEYIKNMEYELILNALNECKGNVEQAARLIDMSIPFVYKKIKELNIKI